MCLTELNRKDFATNSDVNDEIGKLDSALSGEISKKQNALVSGENIKTINGISLLGNGNIVITGSGEGGSVDLSDYYTKGEVDNLIDNVEVDLTGYATETYVSNNYQPKGNYLTSIPSEYVTETELTAKNYATKSEIPTIPTNVSSFNNDSGYITNSALNGYATETYVSNNYQVKGNYITSIPSEYVTESELQTAIEDSNNIVYLTQAEYDSLGVNLDPSTLYLISDAANVVNFKTINGESILGEGNITIESETVDLSNYYTKTECDGRFQLKGNYLTSIPAEYITETELTNKGYATTTYVDTQIGDINTILENIIG